MTDDEIFANGNSRDEEHVERRIFWSAEFDWPDIDPEGLVFLARAVNLVGKAMFPTEWDGEEPMVRFAMGPLEPWRGVYYSFQRWQLDECRSALLKIMSRGKSGEEIQELQRRFHYDGTVDVLDDAVERATGYRDGDASLAFDETTWASIAELSARLDKRDTARLSRFSKVKQGIAQAILAGKMGFTAIPVSGGRWIACDRENWSVLKWDRYFRCCKMTHPGGTDTECLIFLDDGDLSKYLRSLGIPTNLDAAWRPADGETINKWCIKPAVLREATVRAERVYGKNPQEKQKATALATMWFEGTGTTAEESSIRTYLSSARAEKKETKAINRSDAENSTI